MRVLVTGANGFLGRHVVAAVLARGHAVRALVRPAARLDELGWPASVEVIRADLRAGTPLEPAFEGIDVLVHLAAQVGGGDDAQFAATVAGTERLLGAMAKTSCRRLVLASSFSVYDWSSIRGTLDETSPIEPVPDLYRRDGYSIAKSWQERVTRRFAEQHGFQLTVLRPGFIWGRDHGYLAALGQRMGRFHIVVGPLLRMPLTHVDNCAHLFALAAEDPRAAGRTLNVVDGDGPRVWSYLGDHLRGTGEPGIRIPVPHSVVWLAVNAAFRLFFRNSTKLPGVLTPCQFQSRFTTQRFTNRGAQQVLGWQPPLGYGECLRRTYGTPAPQKALSANATTTA